MGEEGLGSGAKLEVDSGPGTGFLVFATMEDLLDKLKLLNYEKDLLQNKQYGLKPLSKLFFAVPTNPGEQFHLFTSIAAWLIRIAGRKMDQPQEYDDPNSTIATILQNVKEFGHPIDFAPSKLKSGYGDFVVYVLDKLADEALKNRNFQWHKPERPREEDATDEPELPDDGIAGVGPDVDGDESSGDEDMIEDDVNNAMLELTNKSDEPDLHRPEEILVSGWDPKEWTLEVERVLPQLKVQLRTDNKDWRVHLEQMQNHNTGIATNLEETKKHLEKLHKDISTTMHKISSREKYINQQLDQLLTEFRALQDKSAETKEKYRQASGGVTERSRILAEITDELDKVKQEMEERGSNMTDSAPLVRIKQALTRLKQECLQMDIRIGVLEQILMQGKLKDKTALQRDMHAAVANNDPFNAAGAKFDLLSGF